MFALLANRAGQSAAQLPSAADLFAEHNAFVWRSLAHLGTASADLEDALQEVFVVVHRRLGDYREEHKVRAWLYAICVRVSRDFQRKRRRRRENLTSDPPDTARDPSQLECVSKQQALALAQRFLEALSPEQRAVFLLYEVEQMSMSEVAAAVQCPLHTAYSRYKKARERVLGLASRAQRRGYEL